jgi:predicted DNA-binding transcriptional regulator AlpA
MNTSARTERVTACPLPSILGLNREQAAAYIGVSVSLFDEMVADGRMPRPKRANSRNIWDRRSLEKAFARLPGGEDDDNEEWDFA